MDVIKPILQSPTFECIFISMKANLSTNVITIAVEKHSLVVRRLLLYFFHLLLKKTVVRPQQDCDQDIDQTNETFLNNFVTSQHLSVFPSGTYHILMTPVFKPPFVITSQVIDSSVSISSSGLSCAPTANSDSFHQQ